MGGHERSRGDGGLGVALAGAAVAACCGVHLLLVAGLSAFALGVVLPAGIVAGAAALVAAAVLIRRRTGRNKSLLERGKERAHVACR